MKGLIIALQFLTRIPIKININITEAEFGSSSKYFPVVGLIIGSILSLTYILMRPVFPSLVIGALIIVLEIIITGGIHFDGFMDTADGLLSARPREQTLEIMKDSRVGAHSVTALFCLLLVKYSLVVSLPKYLGVKTLLLMPLLGRWLMLFCIAFFPYARNKGLGMIFWKQTSKKNWYFSTILVLIIVSVLFAFSFKYLLVVCITFLLSLTPILLINNQLQGHTGDTYGAVNEITEVLFLLTMLLISQI